MEQFGLHTSDQCKNDLGPLVDDLRKLIDDALTNKIFDIINDFTALINKGKEMMTDCAIGVSTVDSADCMTLIGQFFHHAQAAISGGSLSEDTVVDLAKEGSAALVTCMGQSDECSNDLGPFLDDLKKLYDDVQSQNIFALIGDMQKLMTEAKQIASDCHFNLVKSVSVKNGDMDECIKDVELVAEDVMDAIKHLGGATYVIKAVTDCVTAGTVCAKAAGAHVSEKCKSDIQGLMQEIGQVPVRLWNLDIQGLEQSAAKVIKIVNDMKDVCK